MNYFKSRSEISSHILKKQLRNKNSFLSKGFIGELKKEAIAFQNGFSNAGIDITFYEKYINVVSHPQYQMLRLYNHHNGASIYDHNVKVAYLSFKIGKRLKLRLDDIVRGALLHDFFFYDWRKQKPKNGGLHGIEHPKESMENAIRFYSPLSSVEKDIILKHMWPLTIVPPLYVESLIVCLVDKVVALLEFAGKI
ncbi:MAG: HD domain-containing protein [Brevinematia bacterium]